MYQPQIFIYHTAVSQLTLRRHRFHLAFSFMAKTPSVTLIDLKL